MNVVEVLERSAGVADALALVGQDAAWTYADLRDAVAERAAAFPEARGSVRPMLVRGTEARSVVDLLACWQAGSVPALLNARLSEPELHRARAVLDAASLPEGAQVVLWTSGTSGRARGVALSFANLRAITEASGERLGLQAGDVWLGSLSLAHVGGLVLAVRSLLLGSTLVSAGAVDTARLHGLVDEGLGGSAGSLLPTHLSLVPTQLHRLLEMRRDRAAPPQLSCVLIGGAHAPTGLVERAVGAGWPIALTYGCTEMTSQVATAGPAQVRTHGNTVGRPLAGVELRTAEDGEILVRGATRALGYVVHPGEEEGDALADAEGWYHTGDIGRLDDRGYLRVVGRRAERIVSGGVTVDALEVEEAVRAHPSVVDVCVVGVPDEEWGERVAALVVPVEGEFDPEEVDGFARERLMRAKCPTVWNVVAELPLNPNGKVDRRGVRAELTRANRGRPSVPSPRLSESRSPHPS